MGSTHDKTGKGQRQRQEVKLRNHGIKREHEEQAPPLRNSLDAEVAFSDFPALHAHHAWDAVLPYLHASCCRRCTSFFVVVITVPLPHCCFPLFLLVLGYTGGKVSAGSVGDGHREVY